MGSNIQHFFWLVELVFIYLFETDLAYKLH